MKKMLRKTLWRIMIVYIFVTLLVNYVFQLEKAQTEMIDTSKVVFSQIEAILDKDILDLQVSERKQYSYLFSVLGEDGVSLYAVNPETYKIFGSKQPELIGKKLTATGIKKRRLDKMNKGFHTYVNGKFSFCFFENRGGVLMGRVCTVQKLYNKISISSLLVILYLTVAALILILNILHYLEKNVVRSIYDVNRKLESIAEGNMNEKVEVYTTEEFTELSRHINDMVKGVIDTNDKLSSVLEVAQLPIVIYEYGKGNKQMKITGRIAEVFGVSKEEAEKLGKNQVLFTLKLEQLKSCPVDNEGKIFMMPGEEERYIRIESYVRNGSIMGVLMDVTKDIKDRDRIRKERDEDILTGLYNRRAFARKSNKRLNKPEELKYAAMITIDTDYLKRVNDGYGHEAGDCYLCGMAQVLRFCTAPSKLMARLSGDEFAILIYGCQNKEELSAYIKEIEEYQDGKMLISIKGQTQFPLYFSMGKAFFKKDGESYDDLMKCADERMYEQKRKKHRERG